MGVFLFFFCSTSKPGVPKHGLQLLQVFSGEKNNQNISALNWGEVSLNPHGAELQRLPPTNKACQAPLAPNKSNGGS